MAFIEFNDKEMSINNKENDFDEHHLIEKMFILIKAYGFDRLPSSTGLQPGSDFGYFELAGRYWRAGLGIYIAGVTGCFVEAGEGFLEPWLFNIRHGIELYLKGLCMGVEWYKVIRDEPLMSSHKEIIDRISTEHNLCKLYEKYSNDIKLCSDGWPERGFPPLPSLSELMLTGDSEILLQELSSIDFKGFRFRYPSQKNKRDGGKKLHKLHRTQWVHDQDKLMPNSGLPSEAGIVFDHIKVMNALYELKSDLFKLVETHEIICMEIHELQQIEISLIDW